MNISQPVFPAPEPLTSPISPLTSALKPTHMGSFTLAHLLLVIAVVAVLSTLVTSLIFPGSPQQMSSAGSASQSLDDNQ